MKIEPVIDALIVTKGADIPKVPPVTVRGDAIEMADPDPIARFPVRVIGAEKVTVPDVASPIWKPERPVERVETSVPER